MGIEVAYGCDRGVEDGIVYHMIEYRLDFSIKYVDFIDESIRILLEDELIYGGLKIGEGGGWDL